MACAWSWWQHYKYRPGIIIIIIIIIYRRRILWSGRHAVEILHNGQAIMGSPFFVEIYDPNKIRIEGTRTGTVNERMEFDSM